MAKTKYRVQGISFPNEELYQAALKKAQDERRSLSNYICGLLEADLKEPMAMKEEGIPSFASEVGKQIVEQAVSYVEQHAPAKAARSKKAHRTARVVPQPARPATGPGVRE